MQNNKYLLKPNTRKYLKQKYVVIFGYTRILLNINNNFGTENNKVKNTFRFMVVEI